MNPDLDISVPVRITQAIADQRVKYELPPILGRPTRGTKVLIEELQAHDTNNITTEIYGTDKVSDEEKPLGAHFTTINVDTEALIAWLTERFVAS